MSLGNQSDDYDYGRAELLREAAIQMVIHGESRDSAIRQATKLQNDRQEAESRGEVERDEHGNTSAYLQDSLNPANVEPGQLEAVALKYKELCSEEGVDPN